MTSTDLARDTLELLGRIRSASNATFVGQIGTTTVVYKPVAGEQPLWDFPGGTLAEREVAAFELSQHIGWNIVPTTWLRDGPHGPGMVQMWCEPDAASAAVIVTEADESHARFRPAAWHRIIDGFDSEDRPVTLLHEESVPLRQMAVFDIIVNNADRKGGHVLAMPDGHRFGVDHGLTFHTDHKLRTVLWGWIGRPLTDDEQAGVRAVRSALEADLGTILADLITADEIQACIHRCEALLARGTFPAPARDTPSLPWPPL